MKIAILTATFFHFSGVDRVAEQQAKKYVAAGNLVNIFTFESSLSVPGVEVKVLGMPKRELFQRIYRLFFFLDRFKINKYSSQLKNFDIVYSYQYPISLVAAKAKKKYGTTFNYLNFGIPPAYTFETLHEKLYIRAIKWLTNRTIRKADNVVSISNYLSGVLKSETGITSEVTRELFDVEKKRFDPSISGTLMRQKIKLGSSAMILYVGRISPHKGVHLLIKAFIFVRNKIPDARLVIVGKNTFTNYSKGLEKMSSQNVVFTGYISDEELPQYYAACTVYATTSLWEGFDLPIIEAQAMGKPVVAFDIGSHKEVVNSNGKLIEPGNVMEFSEALVKMLS